MDTFHLQQTWPSVLRLELHAWNDTIEFIFHKYKQKDRRATYVRAVCDVRTQKNRPIEQDSLQEVI